MRIYLLLLVLLLQVANVRAENSSEQVKLNKQQENRQEKLDSIYNYWSSRAIIGFLNEYMQNCDEITVKNGGVLGKGEKDARVEYKTRFVDNDRVKELADVHKFLVENNWNTTAKTILQPFIDKRGKRDTLLTKFFIIDNPDLVVNNYQLGGWKVVTDSCIAKYKQAVSEVDYQPIAIEPKAPREDLDESSKEESSSNHKFWEGFIAGAVSIFFLLSVIIVFLIYRLKQRRNSINDLKEQNSKLEKSNKELEKANRKQEQEKTNLQTKKKDEEKKIKQQQKREKNKEGSKEEVSSPKTQAIKVFYSMPDEDGTFTLREKQENSSRNSNYSIEFMTDSNTGTLKFLSSSNDRATVDKRTLILQPACDIENTSDAYNAQSIRMISEGEVQRQGDNWRVTKKIKIKFI